MKWNINDMQKIIKDYNNYKSSNKTIKNLLVKDNISRRELYYIIKVRYPRLMGVKQ